MSVFLILGGKTESTYLVCREGQGGVWLLNGMALTCLSFVLLAGSSTGMYSQLTPYRHLYKMSTTSVKLACEYSHFSLLLAARGVLPGGMSVTP